MGEHTYPIQWTHKVLGEKGFAISRDDFDHIVFSVKNQCKEVAERLIEELERWFPDVNYLNALGIAHPQFWVKEGAEEKIAFHMASYHQ